MHMHAAMLLPAIWWNGIWHVYPFTNASLGVHKHQSAFKADV